MRILPDSKVPARPRWRARARSAAAAALIALCLAGEARAWGLAAHRIVTREAAGRMPAESGTFFPGAGERLAELSLEPDTVLRKRDDREAPRHYINLDALDDPPFSRIPRVWGEAVAVFGRKRLERQGRLPWRILEVLDELEGAMRSGARGRILEKAGHLAHYVGDLFQPLHLTKNFDGRETCNRGIHDAFESEMIERRTKHYREAVARGGVSIGAIADPAGSIQEWMRESWGLADEILDADTAAMRSLKADRKDYYDSMDRLAGPVAERQMSAAANAIASLWYTAWIAAGKPELPLDQVIGPK